MTAGTLLISKDAALHTIFYDIPTSKGEYWASLLEPYSVGAI